MTGKSKSQLEISIWFPGASNLLSSKTLNLNPQDAPPQLFFPIWMMVKLDATFI